MNVVTAKKAFGIFDTQSPKNEKSMQTFFLVP